MQGKRFIANLLIFAIIGSIFTLSPITGVASESGNLLLNGGFEDGMEHWDSWGETVQVTDEEAYTGTKSLKANGVGTANSNAWSEAKQVLIPTVSGIYTISGYVKTNATNPSDAWRSRLMIKEENASDEEANVMKDIIQMGLTMEQAHEWTYFEFDTDTPLEAGVRYVFYIKANDGGAENTYYYDDLSVVFKQAEEPPTSNLLIKNGDFEDGAAYWDIYNTPSSQGIVIAGGDAQSGSYALKVNIEPNVWNDCKQAFKPTESATYVVSGYVKTNLTNKNEGWISKVMVREGTTELATWDVSKLADVTLPINEWTLFSFEVNLEANVSYQLRITGDAGTAGLYFMYDNLSVTKKVAPPLIIENNILLNGGFEDGENHWSPYHGNQVAIAVSTEQAHTGIHSYKVNGVGEVGDNNWSDSKQQFSTTKAGTYVVSGYVLTNCTNPDDAWRSKISIVNADNTEIISKSVTDMGLSVPISEWTYFTFEVQLEAGQNYLFKISANDGGVNNTFYYDDLALVYKEETVDPGTQYDLFVPMPSNVVSNGGFEEGSKDWTSNYWANNVAQIITGDAPEGLQYVKLSNTDPGDWFSISQQISVEPNTDYVVKFKVNVESSSTTWGVYAKLATLSGSDLQEPFNPDVNKRGWQDCMFSFNSQENTSLTFYIGGNESTFSIDDVVIKKDAGLLTSINESRNAIVPFGDYTLSGNISESANVKIVLNGVPYNTVTTGSNNEFSLQLPLKEGENTITVTPVRNDVYGDSVSFKLYMQRIAVENVVNTGTLTAGQSLSSSMNIRNLASQEQDVIIIMAIYSKDNTLILPIIKSITLNAGETVPVTIGTDSLPSQVNADCRVKVFMINNWDNLRPYSLRDVIWQ